MNTFPHRCSCGRSYSFAEWLALPHLGEWVADEPLSLRNCVCKSTMAVHSAVESAYQLAASGDVCGLHEASLAAFLRLALAYQTAAREGQDARDNELAHDFFEVHGTFDQIGASVPDARELLESVHAIEPREWLRTSVGVAREIVDLFGAAFEAGEEAAE